MRRCGQGIGPGYSSKPGHRRIFRRITLEISKGLLTFQPISITIHTVLLNTMRINMCLARTGSTGMAGGYRTIDENGRNILRGRSLPRL